jgi:3-oxoacyl-[acyl-carrier protein] reductase
MPASASPNSEASTVSDRYAKFAASPAGRSVVKRLGLPSPPRLRRYAPGDPVAAGPIAVGGTGRLVKPLHALIEQTGAATAADGDTGLGALIFDATGIIDLAGLDSLYGFFHPRARSLAPSGRLIVLGTPPSACDSPEEAAAQRALEGFTRSTGKEFGRGTTSQLVYVQPGAEHNLASTLRFLLSGRSAYVSGQVITVNDTPTPEPADWTRPLDGRIALVTGAARGIGEAIATVLARDGATVLCLDVPSAGDALTAVANRIGGSAYQLDLTGTDAPAKLAAHVKDRFGHLDAVIHNAGITRDKTLAKMDESRWTSVLEVNLRAPQRVNRALLDGDLIGAGASIVGVASIAGIAGNRGQTNYATSKAGVIGQVQAHAAVLGERGVTINAVAPGFIETAMTAKMPVMLREAGRRMNSMAQGGRPIDVAETIAWLAAPASANITGNVVRVCGQSLLGA